MGTTPHSRIRELRLGLPVVGWPRGSAPNRTRSFLSHGEYECHVRRDDRCGESSNDGQCRSSSRRQLRRWRTSTPSSPRASAADPLTAIYPVARSSSGPQPVSRETTMCGDMAPLTHRSAAMRALATETRDCGAGLASAVGTTWKSSADAKYSQSLSDCSLDFTLAAPSTITLPAVVLSKRILVPLSTLPTHHARPPSMPSGAPPACSPEHPRS